VGRLNEHDPIYPLENEEIKIRKKLKKLKKDRRRKKQKFKKKKKKTPKTFKHRDSRKAIVKRGKHK